jgi:glycosyltransferase involved in cell wall biosynthesis
MNLSILIIGKNTEKTLEKCISSIFDAIQNTKYIDSCDIIYIDSNSSDSSVDIAKAKKVETIEMIDGFTTASLGRYLGLKHSNHNNILFIDGDMELDLDWFDNSFDYYSQYGAIHGERYEKIYNNDVVIKEIPKFFGMEQAEVAKNIGGCFMVNMKNLKGINFSPILKDEEERDFYAKFLDKQLIYRIPVPMFIHNNYNLTTSRLKSYLLPYNKIGYLLSFFYSVKNGYFANYFKLQNKFLISAIASLFFYYFMISGAFVLIIIPIILLRLINKEYYKGALASMIFFPYKLITSIIYLKKDFKCSYRYRNLNYTLSGAL